jgi:hypothetical protein
MLGPVSPALRIMAPPATQRTAFEEHGGTDSRPVVNSVSFYVEYKPSLGHGSIAQPDHSLTDFLSGLGKTFAEPLQVQKLQKVYFRTF